MTRQCLAQNSFIQVQMRERESKINQRNLKQYLHGLTKQQQLIKINKVKRERERERERATLQSNPASWLISYKVHECSMPHLLEVLLLMLRKIFL
jgi:hypothetical protein